MGVTSSTTVNAPANSALPSASRRVRANHAVIDGEREARERVRDARRAPRGRGCSARPPAVEHVGERVVRRERDRHGEPVVLAGREAREHVAVELELHGQASDDERDGAPCERACDRDCEGTPAALGDPLREVERGRHLAHRREGDERARCAPQAQHREEEDDEVRLAHADVVGDGRERREEHADGERRYGEPPAERRRARGRAPPG